ncbi:spore coat assembly protein [Ruminiclostridium sufflavum DSM 19573]|uniref:Spore coat assembly protein n=1 Tax=Ruminiclostridium sufflavum DSM 19573 TaxID=1121337 RepID=A0A318YAS9_9FIRM|nr:sporulation peptidase YabG [Ruminiclostridium sufflavum]PYG89563.1 spore coat assembly protein [Ruminiclostridium sufflavum DSM 19573]
MTKFNVGDIVIRKSYGGDLLFKVVNIKHDCDGSDCYVLRGLSSRIEADSSADDLERQDAGTAYSRAYSELRMAKITIEGTIPVFKNLLRRIRRRPGRILHIDSAEDFMIQCMDFYRQSGIKCYGKLASESKQPSLIKHFLYNYKPDILVITGHDGLKKGAKNIYSLENYANSAYYIESVKIARSFQPNPDKLCIFAGACQSYYEAIMDAGANFASSPKRVLINALDPAIVAQKISITDSSHILTPRSVISLTITGSSGIGGKDTKGQMK